MTPREANVLLTRAALLDWRLRREPEERAQMSKVWAGVLADVDLEVALLAVDEHYAVETRSIMPADITAVSAVRSASWVGNVTEQRLSSERSAVES